MGVFFPHLMTTLCKKASVPMTPTEQLLKPSRSVIDDTLFQQYIELRVKQIKDKNKRYQEMTVTPMSSQRLA
ncbi:hypothetical protein J1N35_010489 [Gossypium stocksii]|uniref:Uncharacterized protein n=1 Tax=Gossypium stocksii TaxID=47602 RepID=A0A9D3W0F2_9ROSI|nr:hypothetical protein J1N35_010489 [Gossypium stocksii]